MTRDVKQPKGSGDSDLGTNKASSYTLTFLSLKIDDLRLLLAKQHASLSSEKSEEKYKANRRFHNMVALTTRVGLC
jgi:hypothetical protein